MAAAVHFDFRHNATKHDQRAEHTLVSKPFNLYSSCDRPEGRMTCVAHEPQLMTLSTVGISEKQVDIGGL